MPAHLSGRLLHEGKHTPLSAGGSLPQQQAMGSAALISFKGSFREMKKPADLQIHGPSR